MRRCEVVQREPLFPQLPTIDFLILPPGLKQNAYAGQETQLDLEQSQHLVSPLRVVSICCGLNKNRFPLLWVNCNHIRKVVEIQFLRNQGLMLARCTWLTITVRELPVAFYRAN